MCQKLVTAVNNLLEAEADDSNLTLLEDDDSRLTLLEADDRCLDWLEAYDWMCRINTIVAKG